MVLIGIEDDLWLAEQGAGGQVVFSFQFGGVGAFDGGLFELLAPVLIHFAVVGGVGVATGADLGEAAGDIASAIDGHGFAGEPIA